MAAVGSTDEGDLLRVALVGVGDVGGRWHLPTLIGSPKVTLAVIADVDQAKVQTARSFDCGARLTTDIAGALADPQVDAVVLATPPTVTPQLTRIALDAGKYVLAEKPLAVDLETARALARHPGADSRLQIGLTYRHHPAIDRLAQLVRAGALGSPLLVQISLCDEAYDPTGDPQGYARNLRTLGEISPVVSDGIHACDRLNYLLGGPPIEVKGSSLRSNLEFPAANVNCALLTYPDGTLVRLEVIWLFPHLPQSQITLTGSRGRAVLDPPTFSLQTDLDARRQVLEPPGEKQKVCFELQLERFVQAALSGSRPVPGISEALESLQLCERIAAACTEQKGPLP